MINFGVLDARVDGTDGSYFLSWTHGESAVLTSTEQASGVSMKRKSGPALEG